MRTHPGGTLSTLVPWDPVELSSCPSTPARSESWNQLHRNCQKLGGRAFPKALALQPDLLSQHSGSQPCSLPSCYTLPLLLGLPRSHTCVHTHTRSPPDPAVCYLGGESALGELAGRIHMGYSQGIGLLWVVLFFLFLHIPTILGKLGPGMRTPENQGQCNARVFIKPMSIFLLPGRRSRVSSGHCSLAESSQLLLYIKTVWSLQPSQSTHQAPST